MDAAPYRRLVSCTIFLLAFASSARSEVMDKVTPASEVWQWSLGFAVAATALARIHPLIGLAAILAPAPPLAALSEILDPFVGPAIRREAGASYILQVIGANAAPVVGYVAGTALWWRARRKRTRAASPSEPSGPGL